MPHTLRRLLLDRPGLFIEILFASLLIALLNLAFPLFSIQVFNRYLGHGHDGTLFALAGGVLIALFFLHGLFLVRGRMLAAACASTRQETTEAAAAILLQSRLQALEQARPHASETITDSIKRLDTAASPATMAALLDFPFSLL